MTLNRNPTDNHTEIEQASFEPNNLVPGIGPSPDKMLLARLFSYADAHRARMGVNYKQIPVNQPKVPVNSYTKVGAVRMQNVKDPDYELNSRGVRRRMLSDIPRWRSGRRAGNSFMQPTRSARTTTTLARPAPWCARSW